MQSATMQHPDAAPEQQEFTQSCKLFFFSFLPFFFCFFSLLLVDVVRCLYWCIIFAHIRMSVCLAPAPSHSSCFFLFFCYILLSGCCSVTRQFQHELCDCHQHCQTCCLACWCPCYIINENARMRDARPESCTQAGLISTLLGVTGLFVGWGGVLLNIYGGSERNKTRNLYGLAGTRCGDYCTSLWCLPCALTQEHAEIMHQLHLPGGGAVANHPNLHQHHHPHDNQPLFAHPPAQYFLPATGGTVGATSPPQYYDSNQGIELLPMRSSSSSFLSSDGAHGDGVYHNNEHLLPSHASSSSSSSIQYGVPPFASASLPPAYQYNPTNTLPIAHQDSSTQQQTNRFETQGYNHI